MHTFTLIFLIFLAAGTALELWLLLRHKNHVAAHKDEVPARFSDKISLQDHQKAAAYTKAKATPATIDILLQAAILLVWTLGGGLNWLAELCSGLGSGPLLTGLIFILSSFLISSLIGLPLSIWRTFGIESQFGFNNTSVKDFVKDLLLGMVLGALIAGPLILLFLWLMSSVERYWWLIAWAVWVSFTLLISWLFPTFIAPLFNKFTPLDDGETRQRVEQLLERCGFKSNGIFVMDGSRRSSHGNAYFTGFGNSKRIVFFDTLLESLNADEMEAVLAHELGHFKHKHVRNRLIMMFTSSLIGFWLLGWLSDQSWFYSGLGVSHPSDAAALLLFLLASPVFTFFLSPISAYFSRKQEFQADDFAIDQTSGEMMIHALLKLYQENANTLTPDPLYSAFYDSHPPAPVRIAHIDSRIN